MAEDRDVRFVTEESFDFGILSPSDSQDEEEDEESPGGGSRRGGGCSGRWSPLRGARLEEMVREATRLAAQLEGCHLPPPAPGDPPGPAATPPGTPRSPRRQTFVVKDSPVRALLPTVESQAPPPAKPRGGPAATAVPKTSPSRHFSAAPKGPPGGRGPPPSRGGPPRPCLTQGQGGSARGRSEPPRGATAGQPKARGGPAPCPPPTRQPHTRSTVPPGPSGRPPAPGALPKVPPRPPAAGGRTPIPRGKAGGALGGRGPPAVPQFPHSFPPLCRHGRGAGGPLHRSLGLQGRIPPRPPAAPPQDGSEQHPKVTPPAPPPCPPEGLGVPGPPPAWCAVGGDRAGTLPRDERQHSGILGEGGAELGHPKDKLGLGGLRSRNLQGQTKTPVGFWGGGGVRAGPPPGMNQDTSWILGWGDQSWELPRKDPRHPQGFGGGG
ncbi:proline/serine-rich coiled-coil protein 1 isoform X2 [Manacus candei]|uniref:proline/serine-rich coiled-coil protein 1 isoform X2 n=1 Tax=Manacus candei TaxID=415023 RepID=UPI002225E4D6|nr:proline/serine-rich coiled-coil protein 1 isoform X2 [Manacus candei]